MARTDRTAQPTKATQSDRARMARPYAQHDTTELNYHLRGERFWFAVSCLLAAAVMVVAVFPQAVVL
jgi:hypothetical protein